MDHGTFNKRHSACRVGVAAVVFAGMAAWMGLPTAAQQAGARVATRPAEEVLAQIGRSAGVVVLTDSTVQARLPAPGTAATAETVETQIGTMVQQLPAGTTWGKLYAPTPVNGRWNADVVADYARAQARLLGGIPQPAPAGMVEMLGRHVPVEKASEYAAALNLKLVYLVTNPRAPSAATVAASWGQMTPEQQQAFARQQAQRIMSLDPATRQAALRQMMMHAPRPEDFIMKMVLSQMPEQERVDLKGSVAREVDLKGRPGGVGK
jgi:hypothetical protein